MNRPRTKSTSSRRKSARLTRHIQSLIAGLERPVAAERRSSDRVAVPFLLRLTPLDPDGQPLTEEAITVVGKDISQRGLSFFHEHSLPYRRAMIELEHPEAGPLCMELDICWCRFTKLGWYESGGNLTRVIDQVPTVAEEEIRPAAFVSGWDVTAPAAISAF